MSGGYSPLDRFLHRVALGNLTLQKSLADLESRLHAGLIRGVSIERPVFVTSLPRAGTTVLLEALDKTGAFASQTYRDMPFVLCPLLWSSVSRGWRRQGKRAERAHRDGMLVSYDSAEAFEEVMWKAFWPRKYAADRIVEWSRRDRDAEFEEAFVNHLRKVVAARGSGLRYLSKNNANIARLPLLAELLPDCVIVIPFRNPNDHAASLARQHANFLSLHDADRFAQRYMEWLGHHEFGRAFRPFAFCEADAAAASKPGFWLRYWDRAFRHILEQAPRQAAFVDYDRLCRQPREELERLAEIVGVTALKDQAQRFRPATHYDISEDASADPTGREAAQETYAALQRRAV